MGKRRIDIPGKGVIQFEGTALPEGAKYFEAASFYSSLPEKGGHTIRMVVNHGQVVYGTDREFRILRWVENLQPFAIVCFRWTCCSTCG